MSLLLLLVGLSIMTYGQEICFDGIDNDMDGFIDYYDEDCACDDELYNAQCESECADTTYSPIKLSLKWKTEVLNKGAGFSLHNFAVIDNIALINAHRGILEGVENKIVEINLLNQEISDFVILDTLSERRSNDFMIYRLSDLDPIVIVTKDSEQNLVSLNKIGGIMWRKSNISDGFSKLRYIKSADINEDGKPELYTGNSIASLAGDLLFKGQSSEGCNFFSGSNVCGIGASSIAANLTTSKGLEIACGNVVYEVDIINTIDSLGNTFNLIEAPSEVLEGYTGIGDFDGDGLLEVVSSRSNGNDDGGVWIWNPRTQSVLASRIHQVNEGLNGSIPVIVDITNDCIPEIIITHKNAIVVYHYDGSSDLRVYYKIDLIDNSGYTNPTVFDLNSDGIMEIVTRDEEYIYIIDGPTGEILDTFPLNSSTINEQPIITDTDNDGHAEILIQGTDTDPDSLRLFCFESANLPWAPSRRVWNQYGYHVTNVNDDLTIPQYQQNSAAFFDTDSCFLETCPQVYNTFGVQATYRTQKGCQVFEELIPELASDILSLDNCDSIVATISATSNLKNISWYPDLNVDCNSCDMVTIKSDTAISIILVAESETCIISDTLFFELQSQETIETAENICFGDSILFNAEYKLETGTYSYSSASCDTSYILDLTVSDSIYSNIQEVICAGDSIEIGNEIFKEPGEYKTIIPSTAGCDSTIHLSLQVNEIQNTSDILPICQGDSIMIESIWYFGGESVEVMGTNTEGCDSIVSLSIEVVDILSDEEAISFCVGDSMLLHNQWIKESGEYPELFQAQSGCDSVFTYIVTTIPSSAATVERQICEGDSVIIESEIFITEGSFEIITEASNGCDSIITLNLEIMARSTGSSDMEFCMGDSLFIDNQWIYESGEYEIHLQNNVGCDSLVSINVTELPMEMVEDSLFACSGDSILLSGNYYFANQVVSDTIWGDVCPNLRNTTLSFVDLLTTAESIVICQGDTLSVGSLQIFEGGTYPLSFMSESGCDSVHTITATTLETIFDLPSDTLLTDVSIYEYLLDIDTSVWSVSWTSDDIVIDCENCLFQTLDISETTNITIYIFSDDGCEVSHTFQIELADSDEIVYPNIFTPNGDGVNDEWIIDMTNYPTNSLQIYDRWGNKIFAQKNVDIITWDGRTNNQEVNPGVYIFMLEYLDLEGGQEVIFGDITVIR